jgi:hypothetical protein
MAKQEVRRRALGALLRGAVTRWESLLTIAVTIGLFIAVPKPFPEWEPWFWLVGGAIAEGALILSTLTDPRASSEAIAREFEARFDLRAIKSPVSRERLTRAVEYRRSMMTLAERSSGAMRAQLDETINDVSDWIAHMYDLALHIDSFEANRLVEEDRRTVPQRIDKVRTRLEREQDAAVRRDLQDQLSKLELQRDNLNATANSIKRAEIQLDSTLSALGTLYAQMSRLGTKDVDSSRAQRLRLEIRDEVASLQDTIEAMDEVQAQHLRLTS